MGVVIIGNDSCLGALLCRITQAFFLGFSGESDPPSDWYTKKTDVICDEERKCYCWVHDDGPCREHKCNAEDTFGICLGEYEVDLYIFILTN